LDDDPLLNFSDKTESGDVFGIGIGRNDPESFFHIDETSSAAGALDALRIEAGDDDLNDVAGLSFATANSFAKSSIFHLQTQNGGAGKGDLVFAVDSESDSGDVSTTDERMRITSTGLVGIGTTSPSV